MGVVAHLAIDPIFVVQGTRLNPRGCDRDWTHESDNYAALIGKHCTSCAVLATLACHQDLLRVVCHYPCIDWVILSVPAVCTAYHHAMPNPPRRSFKIASGLSLSDSDDFFLIPIVTSSKQIQL